MTILMMCKITGKEEKQKTIKSSDSGITLKCEGCNHIHSHEIGFFAEYFKGDKSDK